MSEMSLSEEEVRAFILSQKLQCRTLQHLAQENVRGAMLEVEQGVKALKEIFAETLAEPTPITPAPENPEDVS